MEAETNQHNIEYLAIHANWPGANGEHKVVQMYVLDKPYLRFAGKTTIHMHNGIMLSALSEFSIRIDRSMFHDKGLILPTDGCQVPGMGWADVDLEKKTATFFGLSKAYDLPIDPNHLEAIRPYLPEWSIIIGSLTRRPNLLE
ncbi:MAG: hypothetical protein AABX47_06100 [Nanoarchaeota archaeon]|mgnify:FL=1